MGKTSMNADIEVARAQAVQFDCQRVKTGSARVKVECRGYEVFIKKASRTPVAGIAC